MKTRRQAALLLVICTALPGVIGAAQPEPSPTADQRAGTPTRGEAFVSMLTRHSGAPILAVRYPWKRHARPSVEVRVLHSSELGAPLIRPMFFVHSLMKGNVTTAVYRCQDKSENVPQSAVFSKGEFDFEVFGARNSLGRPSVCVTARTANDRPRAPAKPTQSQEADELSVALPESRLPARLPETRAAFPLLDAWAVDDHTLYLELPAKYFAQPCKLRIWLLRRSQIVWTATLDWPGYPDA